MVGYFIAGCVAALAIHAATDAYKARATYTIPEGKALHCEVIDRGQR